MNEAHKIDTFNFEMLNDLKYNPSIILSSARAGGKSVLLNSLVQHLDAQFRYSHIFTFSQTDRIVNGMPFMDQECIYDNMDNCQSIIEKRINTKTPVKDMTNICILFNDIQGMKENNKLVKNSDSIEYIFTLGRHVLKATIIVLVQRATMLSPLIRVNADVKFIWVAKSHIEKKKIMEENLGLAKNKKESETVYEQIFNGTPYNCMCVLAFKQGITKLNQYIYQFVAPFPIPKFKTRSLKDLKKNQRKQKKRHDKNQNIIPDTNNKVFNIYNEATTNLRKNTRYNTR